MVKLSSVEGKWRRSQLVMRSHQAPGQSQNILSFSGLSGGGTLGNVGHECLKIAEWPERANLGFLLLQVTIELCTFNGSKGDLVGEREW